jgi:uncharacterized protein (AIM24 family)
MVCSQCGKESPEGTKFCMSCGAPMQAAAAAAAPAPAPAAQPAPAPAASEHSATSLGALYQESIEVNMPDAFVLQNKKLLKVNMQASGGQVLAKNGAMIAYQGQMNFTRASSGMDKWIKKKISGEQFDLMNVTGTGDLFLADAANEVILLYLNNEALQVDSYGLLAFSPSLNWDITMIKGAAGMMTGGLWTVELQGSGYVALICKGEPMTLQVSPDQPTFTDPHATVAWSQGLSPNIHVDASLTSIKGLLGSRHGEVFQLLFQGNGFVIVQPSEVAPASSLQQPGGGGAGPAGGILGGLLGR